MWTEVSRHLTAAGKTGDPGRLSQAAALLTDLAERERQAVQILSGSRRA